MMESKTDSTTASDAPHSAIVDGMPSAQSNRLLALLPPRQFARLATDLEDVELHAGDVLYDSAGPVSYVYFPTTALISTFSNMASGASAEVALIGNDGALGVMAVLCGVPGPFRCVVDRGGHTYRIKHAVLHRELTAGSPLQQVLIRYLMARMIQMAASSVCNGHHSVEQRLCRALLMRLERLESDTLFMTHESAAEILGVRRAGVTEAAAHLRSAGAIDYNRGRLSVLDREILKQRACECYESARLQMARFNNAVSSKD
jgi:CRP-like cAMP-binding protein